MSGHPDPACARLRVLLGHASATTLELVFGLVPPADLLAAIPVCAFWRGTAASDEVWAGQCEALWSDKVHVPDRFSDPGARPALPRIAAYWGSLADSRRTAITPEELCSFAWSSRMKGSAGEDWTHSDPWWSTPPQPAGARRYRPDGTTSSSRGEGTWRFVPDTCGRTGPLGSFVRHGRSRIEFPTHVVSRWPPNWGWVMQNCWGFSASFELPLRGAEPGLEDDAPLCRSVSVHNCEEEATCFNLGLPLPHTERGDPFAGGDGGGAEGSTLVMINGRPRAVPRELILQILQTRMMEDLSGESGDDAFDGAGAGGDDAAEEAGDESGHSSGGEAAGDDPLAPP